MRLYLLTTHEVSTMASLDRSANGEVKFMGENTAWPEQGFQELVTVSWILCLNNRANAPYITATPGRSPMHSPRGHTGLAVQPSFTRLSYTRRALPACLSMPGPHPSMLPFSHARE